MHVAAPLRVEFRVLDGWRYAIAYCDGARVSEPSLASTSAYARDVDHIAWAEAFCDGIAHSPMVAGVRA